MTRQESSKRYLVVGLKLVPADVTSGEEASEERLTLCGLVGLKDLPRPEVSTAIEHCRSAGIKMVMVTGDHPVTAVAIAREIDLMRSKMPVVLRGDALLKMMAAKFHWRWTHRRYSLHPSAVTA